MSKYRSFEVIPGVCGFTVKMGCADLYFGNAESLIEAIGKYLTNPEATEREYLEKDIRYNNSERPDSSNPAPIVKTYWQDKAVIQKINVGDCKY